MWYRQLFDSCLQIILTAHDGQSYKFNPAEIYSIEMMSIWPFSIPARAREALVDSESLQVRVCRRSMSKEVTTCLPFYPAALAAHRKPEPAACSAAIRAFSHTRPQSAEHE